MVASQMVALKDFKTAHFADSGSVKCLGRSRLMITLLTLDKSRLMAILLNLGKSRLMIILMTLDKSRFLTKLPQEKLECQAVFTFYLLVFQASSFLIQRPFPEHNQLGKLQLPTLTVQHLRDLQDARLFHWPSNACDQTLPREAENFPRGARHSKHVPLLI